MQSEYNESYAKKLESLFDGCFVATNGFGIFKDKALLANLRKMTAGQTVVIMTDSDRAGFRIRKYLHDTLKEADLFDVYIPDIFGREKRKEKPSAEGKLGVEGMPPDVLRRLAQTIAAAAPVTRPERFRYSRVSTPR